MNGTNMDPKQDTTAIEFGSIQATAQETSEIKDTQDSIEGYRQVSFNPDDLQQGIQEQRQARIAGIPVSK